MKSKRNSSSLNKAQTKILFVMFRKSLSLTQEGFSKKYNISLGTIRRWEQEKQPGGLRLEYFDLFTDFFAWYGSVHLKSKKEKYEN